MNRWHLITSQGAYTIESESDVPMQALGSLPFRVIFGRQFVIVPDIDGVQQQALVATDHIIAFEPVVSLKAEA